MALTRSDGLLYDVGFGYSALDAAASRDRLDGFAVVDGLAVTAGTGLSVDVATGTATVGETSGTVDTVSNGTSTNVSLTAADATDPRKDTVYIDTAGAVQVETGVAEPYDPSDETLFDTFQPEPPEPSTAGVILAEVVVPAGASTINTTDHVRDRRQPAQAVFNKTTATTTVTDEITFPVETPSDVSGSRSLDTWETNSTGKPLMVSATIFVSGTNVSSNDLIRYAFDNAATQSANQYNRKTRQSSDGSTMDLTVGGIVPDGGYYRVQETADDTGSADVFAWYEHEVGAA